MKKVLNKLSAILLIMSIIFSLNLTVFAEVEYNTEEVTVYITVTDISDYTKPINILVPRRELTVSNFNLADYGDTLDGIICVTGTTYLHALVQLHRELYGDELVKSNFMLNEDGYTKYFMGRSTANVMYKNGKDIFAYPQMVNIKNGDEIQVCLYDEGHSQAISTFSDSRIDNVKVNEKVSLSLYQHYNFPRNRNPIQGAEICDENGIYITDADGNIITTDKNGEFKVSFDEPGTYTISAMPQVDYYMSENGGEIITEWVPKVVTTTEEVTVNSLIGYETTIHDPTDLTDDVVKQMLVFWGDYSNAPTYEAETATISGEYSIISEDNAENYDLTTLSGNSAVLLNPGSTITIPITTTVSGKWIVFFNCAALNENSKGFSIAIDGEEPHSTKCSTVLDTSSSSIYVKKSSGLRLSDEFSLGQHTVTLTADSSNTEPILVDNLIYGENVTEFVEKGADLYCDSIMLTYWDDTVYDSYLTPSDSNWVSKVIDKRSDTSTPSYITSHKDIVDTYTKLVTKEETVLEKVERVVPADLLPKVSYTTPLVTINVVGDLTILNPTITTGTTTATLKFDTKNKDSITEKYTCYVATYDENDILVELKTLSSLRDYSNSVTLSNLDYNYLRIFCWSNNMTPLCSTELVTPNTEVEATSLDWDYTMSTTGYDTYTTSPTVEN